MSSVRSFRSRFKSIFLFEFFNRKTIFHGNLNFLCLLHSLMGYFFQCVVSNVKHAFHGLKFHSHHNREVYRVIGFDFGGVQVCLM